jgi:cysteine desulfurase / selenocysteine lyase
MDPLEARSLFPLVDRCIFMNHAGVSPLSDRCRAAITGVVEALTQEAYPSGWAGREADRVRGLLARLLGAPAEGFGLTRGTAHGLSLVARGLDWREGDNVVGARGEYPANVYPWMALGEQGVEFRMAEPVDGRVTPEAVLELVDERTRVVALSHVEFWNGYRLDLQAIGSECRRRGALLVVDAIQSAGAMRLDLGALPVDVACAGAYKWLLGPQGSGFFWCRPDLVTQLRPALVGTGSVKNDSEYFAYDLDYAETGRRFEESSQSLLNLAAFGASLDLLLEVGMEAVEERILTLAARLAGGLAELGYELLPPWPREAAESSGIVSFRRPGSSPQEVMRDLSAARVVGRIHSDFVRLSPHFYNTEEEVDQVLTVLAPADPSEVVG